jgi:hypothetical protein
MGEDNKNIIPFKVSARTARLIGRENVASSKGAIIELVKNAYDADSTACIVYFDNKFSTLLPEIDEPHLKGLLELGLSTETLNAIYDKDEDTDRYLFKADLAEDIVLLLKLGIILLLNLSVVKQIELLMPELLILPVAVQVFCIPHQKN